MLPLARTERDGLIVEPIAPETVIFDLRTRRAICLNPAATMLWRRCDGQTSVADLAAALRDELNLDADEDTVWAGLEALRREQLLEWCPAPPKGLNAATRRKLRRRLIIAAGTALVSGIAAPAVLAAASCVLNHTGCLAKDAPCTQDGQCCSCKCTGSNKCQ